MKVYANVRGSGKTTELIRESGSTGYRIMCSTRNNKNYILGLAKDMKIKIPEPLTFSDVTSGRARGIKMDKILVDEGFDILNMFLTDYGLEIATVTLPLEEIIKVEKTHED